MAADAPAIARLHAESWRQTYAGLLPADYLADAVDRDRLDVWRQRLAIVSPRARTLTARSGRDLVGFVHVELDADPASGALLANLHVRPHLKGVGIGTRLFSAAREWIAGVEPGSTMYLWVLEQNADARRFYERRGGQAVERQTLEIIPDCRVAEVRYMWPAFVR